MLRVLAPVLISAALGWLVLRLFFRPNGAWLSVAFYAGLGIPTGAGVFGISSFLTFLVVRPGSWPILAAFCVPAAIAAGAGWVQARGRGFQPLPLRTRGPGQTLVLTPLAILCCLVGLAGALLLIESFVREPHGMWDAHAMWNARARVLFRAPEYWRDVFLPNQFHPDYPLSLSILVYTGWAALGREAQAVPFAVGCAFLLASAGIVGVGLTVCKDRAWGLVAIVLILCEQGYVSLAGWQYADVPLSAMFAAAVVLFTLAYRDEATPGGAVSGPALALAGAVAGLCAWIKNEGAPIALGFTAGLAVGCLVFARKDWFRQLAYFWAGAGPVLAILQYYRSLAPRNDIIWGATRGDALQKLADAHRWETILRRYADAWWHAPETVIPLVLMIVFAWALAGIQIEQALRLPLLAGGCAIASVAAAQFAAYLVTPNDLAWHLNTSVNRMPLQLMPAAIFLAFLVVRPGFLAGEQTEETAGIAGGPPLPEQIVPASGAKKATGKAKRSLR